MLLSNYYSKLKKQRNEFCYWKILQHHDRSFNCVSCSFQIDNRIVYERVNNNAKHKRSYVYHRLLFLRVLMRLFFKGFFFLFFLKKFPRAVILAQMQATRRSVQATKCFVTTEGHDSWTTWQSRKQTNRNQRLD